MSPRFRIGAILLMVPVGLIAIAVTMRTDAEPTVRLSIAVNEEFEFVNNFLPAAGGWPYTQRIAADWGVADEFGVNIELVPRVTGKGTIEALVDNNADIAYMAAPPLITAIANGDDVLILALTERSDRQIRLVARADHADDWIDHPIGSIPGTAFASALAAEIEHAGRTNSPSDDSLELVAAQHPPALLNSLIEGTIDSAILFQPQAALLTERTNGRPTAFVDVTTPGLYEFDGFLVTTRSRWESNREAILLALQATKRTRLMIAEDPDRRLRDIHNHEAGATNLKDTAPWFWAEDEVVFVTDRDEVIDSLSREAKLQIRSQRLDAAPNFGDALGVIDEVAQL